MTFWSIIFIAYNYHVNMCVALWYADSEVALTNQVDTQWWVKFHEACSQSPNISSALLMALVGRSVSAPRDNNVSF